MTQFKSVRDINKPEFKENLRDSVITFADWGYLNMGAYYNVEVPTSGSYGGAAHQLRPVSDPRFTDGQVWEGFRKNWVWESGLPGQSTQPIQISGVYVDGSFSGIDSGYYIDYPNGRVVFNTAISTSSTVTCEHSFKMVEVVDARDVPWFRNIQTRSFRVDDSNFQAGSGDWSALGETRLQLPAVVVEVVDNRDKTGYQIGDSTHWARTDVLFHILAEDDSYASRLADALDRQEGKTVPLFDGAILNSQNRYPLDYRGAKTSNPLTYPDLVRSSGNGGALYTEGVANGEADVVDSTVRNGAWLNRKTYHQTVRWTTEVIML